MPTRSRCTRTGWRSGITQLGGSPNFSPEGLATQVPCGVRGRRHPGGDDQEDLVAERVASRPTPRSSAGLANDDPTTRRIIEDILKMEEEARRRSGQPAGDLGEEWVRLVVGAVAAAAAVAVAAWMLWPGDHHGHRLAGGKPSGIAVSSKAGMPGEALFNQKCAVCHGPRATGSPQGPPLVHRYYEPGHHSDMAFVLAVRRGVRAHHWRFRRHGARFRDSRTPTSGPSSTTVRALQRAKGIY